MAQSEQQPSSTPHINCFPSSPKQHAHTTLSGRRRMLPFSAPLLLFFCLLALLSLVNAIQLDLQPHTTRCVADEYAPEEDSTIKVRAVGRVQDGIRGMVSTPDNRLFWDGYLTAKIEDVKIPADYFGLYKICFWNGGREVQRVEVGLLDKAVQLQNAETAKTKEHLQPLQLLFRRAELTVAGVSKELDSVRQREASLRETSESTDRRIQWFSIFSIVILLAVSIWQVTFLKSFFRAKKLL